MAKQDPADLTQLLSARRQQKADAELRENLGDYPHQEEVKAIQTVVPKETKKIGRPPGRRSDPNCRSLTLLVNEEVIDEAQYKLKKLNRGKSPKQSLSDLVEGLLEGWLKEV